MTDDQFKREQLFQITLSLVSKIHERSQITDDEFRELERLLIAKYQPLLGGLVARTLDFTAYKSDVYR